MSTILVLSGGGIASAVTAARYAKEHSLILLHLHYGQASAADEHRALVGLMPSLPQARLMQLSLPHVLELNKGAIEHSRPGVIQAAAAAAPKVEAVLPASLRGLAPVLFSVGMQAALRVGAETLAVGVTRTGPGAHLGLPPANDPQDLRREFLHAFAVACDTLLGKNRAVRVESPLIDALPADVLRLALRLEVPLAHTWSCNLAGPRPCGQCESCQRRERSFAEVGREDPLLPGSTGRGLKT